MDNLMQGIKTNRSLTDIGVAVFVGTTWVEAVIDMDDCNLVKPKDIIELFQHTFIVSDKRIACITDMAGIKAYTQAVFSFDTIINPLQFLKGCLLYTSRCV